jgi:hypothetical protein
VAAHRATVVRLTHGPAGIRVLETAYFVLRSRVGPELAANRSDKFRDFTESISRARNAGDAGPIWKAVGMLAACCPQALESRKEKP